MLEIGTKASEDAEKMLGVLQMNAATVQGEYIKLAIYKEKAEYVAQCLSFFKK